MLTTAVTATDDVVRVGSLLRGASVLLDAVLVAAGVAALCWRLFIGSLVPGTWTAAAVATLACLVFVVSIMSVLIGVLLSGHRRVPVSMLLVCAAFGVSAVGDVGFSYLVVGNSYSAAFAGASWLNIFGRRQRCCCASPRCSRLIGGRASPRISSSTGDVAA